MNYSIIKGNCIRQYNGSTVCVSISVHAVAETKEQAIEIVKDLYDNETDLIAIIDLKTGQISENI